VRTCAEEADGDGDGDASWKLKAGIEQIGPVRAVEMERKLPPQHLQTLVRLVNQPVCRGSSMCRVY
jgi:hypothetical protein